MQGFEEMVWTLGPLLFMLMLIILIIRWIGAWMFRINDVINLQKEILEELKKITPKE